MHQNHQVVFLLFDGHLTAIFDATKLPQFLVLPIYRHGYKSRHIGLCLDLSIHVNNSGADPGFQKGWDAEGSGTRPQDFFDQFRGLFKEFGTKRGGRAPPPLWIRA